MSGLAFNTASFHYFWAVELDNRTASVQSQCMNLWKLCEMNGRRRGWRKAQSGAEAGWEDAEINGGSDLIWALWEGFVWQRHRGFRAPWLLFCTLWLMFAQRHKNTDVELYRMHGTVKISWWWRNIRFFFVKAFGWWDGEILLKFWPNKWWDEDSASALSSTSQTCKHFSRQLNLRSKCGYLTIYFIKYI